MNFTRRPSASPDGAAPTDSRGPDGAQRATFAARCFWGVEASFRETDGVARTTVGHTGGSTSDSTYEQVCSDKTGHAEAVEVWFDPGVVSYGDLLNTFWSFTTRPPATGRAGTSALSTARRSSSTILSRSGWRPCPATSTRQPGARPSGPRSPPPRRSTLRGRSRVARVFAPVMTWSLPRSASRATLRPVRDSRLRREAR